MSAGAQVLVGGDRAGFERGHFFSPAVVTGAPDTTELLREETFGPVAPVRVVPDFDTALREAADDRYGLAYVYRVFPGISYALVTDATNLMKVGDIATTPR